MTPSLRPLAAALLAAALLAGCGGASSHKPAAAGAASTSSPQISAPQVAGNLDRAHYIPVADGVCAKARTIASQGNQAVGRALQAGQPAAAAAAIQQIYPRYAATIVQLEAIRSPRADRPSLEKIFKIMEEQTRTLPIYARALTSSDRTTLRAVGIVERRLSTQVGKASRAYGFKVCGRS
jgi:hypothetical protein